MRQDTIVIPVGSLRRSLVGLLIVLLVILLVIVARTQGFRLGNASLFAPGAAEVIDRGAYQAVFLTSGSTYFGKVEPEGDDWLLLTEVYYLASSGDSGTQLIKRGSEPQGPREPMIIPTGQVLFIENLRDDSDVVTAIRRFKSGELPAATPPPATPARTTSPAPTTQPSPSR